MRVKEQLGLPQEGGECLPDDYQRWLDEDDGYHDFLDRMENDKRTTEETVPEGKRPF